MVAAFSIYAGLGISFITPSVVGECIRRFGNRRDVSVSPGRSESEPYVAPLPLLVTYLLTHIQGLSIKRQMAHWRLLTGTELWAIPQVSPSWVLLLCICAETHGG